MEMDELTPRKKKPIPPKKKNDEIKPRKTKPIPKKKESTPENVIEVTMGTGENTVEEEMKTDEERLINQMNKNMENSMIEPLFWVLPNKKEFPEWVTETFLKYMANGKPLVSVPGVKKAFKYQKLLRDYMQNKSPYRGVLLYHTLGAGKTMSSIIIAENLKTEKNIVVMLPASLKPNFEKEIESLPVYQRNPGAWREKYTFISYNAMNTLKQIKNLGSLDNKVIIIDEVHNLISKIVSGIMGVSSQGLAIYEFLMEAKNAKIIALSGTPVINDPFEVAVLMNILRGYIEETNFRIVNVAPKYGNTWNFTELESKLAKIPFVDYIEINKVNRSIAFHITVKSYTDEYRQTMDLINSTCRDEGVDVQFLVVNNYALFPIDEEGQRFRDYFILEDERQGDRIKPNMINTFKSRILGLISFYKPLTTNYPEIIAKNIVRVDMSNYQYQIYSILRKKEKQSEKGQGRKSKSGPRSKEKVKSTFRVFSRQASNFVFPDEIPRPYPDPKFVVSIRKTNESETDEAFEKSAELEMTLNENGKSSTDYKRRINTALNELMDGGEVFLRPGPNGLDKLSPKMRMMLDNIQNSKGLIFVYSNFRSLEGIEVFTKILDFNGFASYHNNTAGQDVPRYTMYSGTEDMEAKTATLQMFTSDENKEGKLCKILLATSAGAEGLDLKNIRQIHVMEPYWNQMRIEQVIGRGVRRNSHIALPPEDRNIEIFIYLSVLGPDEIKLNRDKVSTDEYIDAISHKKQIVLDELKTMMKESAFDCILNFRDVQGEYRCFTYGKDASGLAYLPEIRRNVVYSASQNTRQQSSNLVACIYHDKKIYFVDKKNKKMYLVRGEEKKKLVDIPEKYNIVYVNPETYEIYDAKSIKTPNPIRKGFITSKGTFSSTKKD